MRPGCGRAGWPQHPCRPASLAIHRLAALVASGRSSAPPIASDRAADAGHRQRRARPDGLPPAVGWPGRSSLATPWGNTIIGLIWWTSAAAAASSAAGQPTSTETPRAPLHPEPPRGMLTTNPGCCWVSLTCALRLCWFRGAKRASRPRAGVAKVRLVTRRAHALRPASQHHNFSHILTS